IRGEILALRDAGCAVLVVSEELEELFEVSDRLHVIAKGQLSPSVPVAEATVEKIGEWMSGLWDPEVQQHLAELEASAANDAASQPGAMHAQA
ncbi:MAG TPA: ABC transporter ATP-binding protein, partial [Rhodoferax sp.]|nr:ABC transporter ATP-binding protein [Rhodoferax sp.]